MTFLKEFAILPVVLVGLTSLLLLLYPNWRWTLLAMGVQYLAVAWLVSLSWPVGLAAIKLVVGWMAGAVLSTTQAGSQVKAEPLSGRLFRLIAAGMVIIVIFTLPDTLRSWFQVDQAVLLGALVLAGVGLLQTSMTHDPLRIIIGLLTFLAGFEVLYAALEVSVLVAGLLAVVNLGLAMAGAYLLSVPDNKETE
jgi:hypothetical protein